VLYSVLLHATAAHVPSPITDFGRNWLTIP
jgi:hypothetical protein